MSCIFIKALSIILIQANIKEYSFMDSYKKFTGILATALAAALLISTANTPKVSHPEKNCFLFPQFISAAAASREGTEEANDENEPEITFAFGFLELLKRLYK